MSIEPFMVRVEELFPFIAKDGNSVSMAEFYQFMKKAKTINQTIHQPYEEFQELPQEEEDINEVFKSFKSLDIDNDGKLSLEEMMLGLTNEPFIDFSMRYVFGGKEYSPSEYTETTSSCPPSDPSRGTSWDSESESYRPRNYRRGNTRETSCPSSGSSYKVFV